MLERNKETLNYNPHISTYAHAYAVGLVNRMLVVHSRTRFGAYAI